jgi:hygromycin-B 7''-O-kinase
MRTPDLTTIDQYRRLFSDASYWSPFVKAVCEKHGLGPVHAIKTCDVPGTYPVFNVDDKWIVKFFGIHFDGQRTFAVELEVNQLLSGVHDLPRPKLVAHGHLLENCDNCRWPYLVFEFVQGRSLGEVREKLSSDEKVEIARTVGKIARCLHSIEMSSTVVLKPTWESYCDMIRKQSIACASRHKEWSSLPDRLINQIDDFLPPIEEIVDHSSMPSLLHGDLTVDHVLVVRDDSKWKLKAVIDYGDAIVGDPMYELVALHLDLFKCNKDLLMEYLSAYGSLERIGSKMARKLLSLCLLFPFNIFHDLFEIDPSASKVSSLGELADRLWNTEI